jgi:hypothetical protein
VTNTSLPDGDHATALARPVAPQVCRSAIAPVALAATKSSRSEMNATCRPSGEMRMDPIERDSNSTCPIGYSSR